MHSEIDRNTAGGCMGLALVAGLLVVIGGLLILFFGNAWTSGDVSDCPDSVGGIAVSTRYLNKNSMARPGTTRTVRYVVIHETGNTQRSATAASHARYIRENSWNEKKSWHYTVDDTEIWHHLPDNEVGYHAGDNMNRGGGNRNGIGVELCVNEGGNFDQTMKNAAVLTAYLLKKYSLNIHDVKKHQDFSGKLCPQTILEQDLWDDFLDLVRDAQNTYDFSEELAYSPDE